MERPRGGTADLPRRCFRVAVVLIVMTSQWQADGGQLPENVVHDAMRFLPYARTIAVRMLNTTVRKEAQYLHSMRSSGFHGESAFRAVQNFLGSSKLAKWMSYAALVQVRTLELFKARYSLNKRSITQLLKKIPAVLLSNTITMNPDEEKFVSGPDVCPYPRDTRCQAGASFRTFDGCCNNLRQPLWGASFQPFSRLLEPDYADGISASRASKYDTPLPSPRLVTWLAHDDVDNPSHAFSLMVMLFGQFVDHDLSRTAVAKLSDDETGFGGIEDVMCGRDGCASGPVELRECLPIPVPRGDPIFTKKRCLTFVRTLNVPSANCKTGPRQQLNQITSYLDSSHIYGSTRRQADALRDFSDPRRGRLRMRLHPYSRKHKRLLPNWDSFSRSDLCRGANSTIKCFLAGDGRVNEHTGLMCLHTAFSREHNRIESALHRINPHWGGQRLYFETRRIMGAMWQHIVYNEYLPVVLGPHVIDLYDLNLEQFGYFDGYDPDIQVDVSNSFATAAFRYGHSLIQGDLQLVSPDYVVRKEVPLSMTFRAPTEMYVTVDGGADYITRGFITAPSQTVDPHLSDQIVGHLFARHPPLGVGTDLAALNIQRGRDHGLPVNNERQKLKLPLPSSDLGLIQKAANFLIFHQGYAAWRDWCGLGRPRTFADLSSHMPQDIIDKFSTLYDHVEDIDLFPAAISEYHVKEATLGPTFACILADQFHRARKGDRFWYENRRNNPYPFTPDQLASIRQTSLARILCENGDYMTYIQPRVMLLPLGEVYKHLRRVNAASSFSRVYPLYHGGENSRVRCERLPGLDLTKWREMPPSNTRGYSQFYNKARTLYH